jgi:hypothetical protein
MDHRWSIVDPTDRPSGDPPSLRPVVAAILAAALLLAATLVLIDVFRASRCDRYGGRVLAYYREQARMERNLPDGVEVSPATLVVGLIESAGYPPPGCAIP